MGLSFDNGIKSIKALRVPLLNHPKGKTADINEIKSREEQMQVRFEK